MLGWAITFLGVTLIAAVIGFGGVAAVSVEIYDKLNARIVKSVTIKPSYFRTVLSFGEEKF